MGDESRVTSVRIVPDQVTIALGGRVVMAAEPRDRDGVGIAGVRAQWSAVTADGDPVPISAEGEFVGHMPGSYEVRARLGDEVGTSIVEVDEFVVDGTGPAGLVRMALGSETGDEGPRWNDSNAVSAFAPTNRIGYPQGAQLISIAERPWLGSRRRRMPEPVTVGSANFTVSAPVLNLPGRGLDLRLDLTYNSRLWNRAQSPDDGVDVVQFDVDNGWPAPGWSLGFGRMLRLGRQGSMVVEPDGARHPFEILEVTGDPDRSMRFVGRTTDGTFIDYEHIDDISGGLQWGRARHPDGTTVDYTAKGHDYVRPALGTVVPSWGILFPTRITDRNGNTITIAYRNNVGPEIDTIVDTLGRSIQFHYDDTYGYLTAITAPGLGGSRRTIVRLDIVPMRVRQAFMNLRAEAPQTCLVIRAIYYPGTADGYWFWEPGTYSEYGMATKVTRHRGMTFDGAPLTARGVISPGTLTHQRSYDYPLAADVSLADVPTYTTMSEFWDGMDTAPAVTRFTHEPDSSPRRTTVAYPNGTRTVTLAYNRPGQFDDALPYRQETYDGDVLIAITTNSWELGEYRSPRLGRVENSVGGLTTVTEYDYGSYNRVVEVRELAGVNMLRRTRTRYEDNIGCIRRHLLALPVTVEIFAGSGSDPIARTEYAYDGEPLRDAPGVTAHAQSHNPYAPQTWVPPYDEHECDPERRPPCHTIHHPGYWQTEYDASTRFRGNPTEIRRYPDPAQPDDRLTESRTYDIAGNLVSTPDGYDRSQVQYGLETQYGYPARTLRGASAAVVTASTEYDLATGLALSSTDADGETVTMSYEPGSLRPSLVTSPSGATTTFAYDDALLTAVEIVRADGAIAARRTVVRNGMGAVRRQEVEAGIHEGDAVHVTEFRYDALGRLWQQSAPYSSGDEPRFNETFRDGFGRVVRTRASDGSETHAYYDEPAVPDAVRALGLAALGRTTRQLDGWGRERWTLHDPLGRLVLAVEPDPDGDGRVFSPGCAVTQYDYNPLGQLESTVRRAPGVEAQSHEFRYDGVGRLTHQRLAERDATLNDAGLYRGPGHRWSDVFGYADRTRPAWRLEARGVRSTFDYDEDPLGRVQRVSYEVTSTGHPENPYPDAPPAAVPPIEYQYATTGDVTRVVSITSGDTIEDFEYDDRGRLITASLTPAAGPGGPFSVRYGYDDLDRLSRLVYPERVPGGGLGARTVQLEYDLASRPHQITVDGRNVATGANYAPNGLLARLTLGAEQGARLEELYDFDSASGLLSRQRLTRGDNLLLDISYQYTRDEGPGVAGQVVRAVDNLDALRTTSYEYDALGRLRRATGGNIGTPLWVQEYAYDHYGNRVDVTAHGTNEDGLPMVADGIGGLSFNANRVAVMGYAYDEAGNLTRGQRPDGSWQRYSYDALGRLVQVSADDGTALETYAYASDRRRVSASDHGSASETVYVWHGDEVLARYGAPAGLSRESVYLATRLLCSYDSTDQPNALRNPGFDDAPEAPSELVGTGGGVSAASGWTVWNNSEARTMTEVVPSTRTPGGQMLHVTTSGTLNGIVQTFNPDLADAVASIWVFVVVGRVGIGTGNGGATSAEDAESTTIGRWERIQARNGGTPANEFIVYAISPEGADYFVDDAAVTNADIEGPPIIPFRYHHPDRLGTRITTFAQSGQPSEAREVRTLPYGAPLSSPPVTFTSYDRSVTTGLDYAVNRHYDPALGRFLETDPLGQAAMRYNEPQTCNAYIYGVGDPVNTLDPTGLIWIRRPVQVTRTVDIAGGSDIFIDISYDYVWVEDPDENTREVMRGGGLEARLEADRRRGDNRAYERLVRPLLTPNVRRPTTQLDLLFGGYLIGVALLGIGGALGLGLGANATFTAPTAQVWGKIQEIEILRGLAGQQTIIPSLTGTAVYRIADLVNQTIGVAEVKWVEYLSNIAQIRDGLSFAEAAGVEYYLITRLSTQLSGPLLELVESGRVDWIPILD